MGLGGRHKQQGYLLSKTKQQPTHDCLLRVHQLPQSSGLQDASISAGTRPGACRHVGWEAAQDRAGQSHQLPTVQEAGFNMGGIFLATFGISAFLTIQWKYHYSAFSKFLGLFYILLRNISFRLIRERYTTVKFESPFVHSAYSLLPLSTSRKRRLTFLTLAQQKDLGWNPGSTIDWLL